MCCSVTYSVVPFSPFQGFFVGATSLMPQYTLFTMFYISKCDWHSVQDEEHILLDYPHEHLVAFAHSAAS